MASEYVKNRLAEIKRPAGRPKGATSKKYVTINSILDAIEDELGMTYQEALAGLLGDSLHQYQLGKNKELFPKLMMQLSNKLIEQARAQPEDTTPELETLTDEELLEKRKAAVIEYIKEHGTPIISEAA